MYLRIKHIACLYWSLLIILIGSCTTISAQDYIANIKHWTIENGLSHRQVNTVFQADDGLMWVGTKNGLNSFNGYEFKHWLGRQDNVDARNIHRIGQDDEGWLWLQQQDNLIFYHPKADEFKTTLERFGANCPLLKISASHYVQGFRTDNFDRIYYEEYESNILYSYHSSEGFLKIDMPKDMESLFTEMNLSEDKLRLDISYGVFGKMEFLRKNLKSAFKFKAAFLKDKNNIIQPVSIDDLLIEAQKMRGQYGHYNAQDSTSVLIINKQLDIHDSDKNLLITIKIDEYSNFNTKYLGQSFFDKNNKLWVSSDFGVYTIDITREFFDFIPVPIYQNQQLAARGISVYDEDIITAFEPGILFSYMDNQWRKITQGDWLRSIYQEKLDEFWFGSYTELIHWKNNIKTVFKLPKSPTAKFYDIWSIIPSSKNKDKFWLGTQLGLLEFDKITQEFTKFKKTNDLIKYYDFHIQTITYDKLNKNHLWLCTNKGLILMDETTGFLNIYNENNTGDNFLPATNFQHLYQDENNIFWLATAGEGLIKWQPETKEYQTFSVANGFANEVIYAVYEDDFDNLWMSSDYGIIKMNKSSFNVENYLLENGIGQTEFNRISHFKTKDGTIYFGGLKGVTRFHPKNFQQTLSAKKSSLTLSNFQQFNGNERKVENKTIEIKDNLNITLRPSDYIFDLQFSVLSYDNSDKNQYIFQFLEHGKPSDNWQFQKTRSIQLGQLPHGNHTLIVKGKDAFGNDCENEIILKINVLKPFYLQLWFLALLFGLAIGCIYFYTAWRTQSFERQQKRLKTEIEKATQQIQSDKQIIETQAAELKQLDKLKSTFFANVSHELRTPLTLMLAPIKSVLKRGGLDNRSFTFLSTAEQNGYRLLRLVNEILDLNKLEAGKLELQEQTIAFYPFVKRIASYFTSYSEDVGIDFYFNYRLEKDFHLRVDAKKVETVVNNLLSNAFKFTPQKGQIEIIIQDKNEVVEIIVKDSGQGIHPNDLPNIFNRFYQSKENNIAEGGTGIGLALSQELAKLIGGDLTAESDLEKGSIFYFTFPQKRKFLKPFLMKIITQVKQNWIETRLLKKRF